MILSTDGSGRSLCIPFFVIYLVYHIHKPYFPFLSAAAFVFLAFCFRLVCCLSPLLSYRNFFFFSLVPSSFLHLACFFLFASSASFCSRIFSAMRAFSFSISADEGAGSVSSASIVTVVYRSGSRYSSTSASSAPVSMPFHSSSLELSSPLSEVGGGERSGFCWRRSVFTSRTCVSRSCLRCSRSCREKFSSAFLLPIHNLLSSFWGYVKAIMC